MIKSAAEWKQYYADPEFHEKYTYEGHNLGVQCSDNGTVFRLWSPCAESVFLRLYKDGSCGNYYAYIRMDKGDKGIWKYCAAQDLHGIYYDYEITIDGETRETADPWAKACGVNGKRSMVVDLSKTNPKDWDMDKAPDKPAENIIYELHVKEFSWDKSGGFPESYRGKYKAFSCEDTTLYGDGIHKTGCAYLKDLGITHIQLMPCYDYGSVDEAGEEAEFNWGYDPVNYNVPEGSYATDAHHGEVRIREMKEMIQSLHKQGFRVVMDVVYNHTYSLDSWFQKTAPWYFYRVNEDGSASNGSACGNDTAGERLMCANYILDSVLYWAEEYHIDGFRFDLMGLLDVKLMNRIRRELDLRYGKGEKILYGEPWAASRTAMEGDAKGALKENLQFLDSGIGIFCDNTRNAVKGSVFNVDKAGFVNGARGLEEDMLKSVRAWQKTEELDVSTPAQIITYASAHDNQTLWDKIADTVPDRNRWLEINKMAAAVYMTCQGNLFLLSGEEFARTKNGLDNTYNESIELNRLDWERAWEYEELVNYYRGLIALRKQLPGLCDKSTEAWKRIGNMWFEPLAVGFTVDNTPDRISDYGADNTADLLSDSAAGIVSDYKDTAWDILSIVYNSREENLKVKLPDGEWQILADKESSFRWEKPLEISGEALVEPREVLILGKKTEGEKEKSRRHENDIR
ncbi:MAG: type I pullulanase [Lachnospiraceae bacterium]|nr:type I pullulanase [Lachnospiraceae bacterium]